MRHTLHRRSSARKSQFSQKYALGLGKNVNKVILLKERHFDSHWQTNVVSLIGFLACASFAFSFHLFTYKLSHSRITWRSNHCTCILYFDAHSLKFFCWHASASTFRSRSKITLKEDENQRWRADGYVCNNSCFVVLVKFFWTSLNFGNTVHARLNCKLPLEINQKKRLILKK